MIITANNDANIINNRLVFATRPGAYRVMFVRLFTWTAWSFGIEKEMRGSWDLFFGPWSLSLFWGQGNSHPLDRAVGLVHAFLGGRHPRPIYLGEHLRSPIGLSVFWRMRRANKDW